ncbi:hypothetical protein [Methylobacterium sp. WSM2598]|uniref:hypothetical protein n=1 Tax=Methylobacterium sp. WSM2598 TaxID=398261 RepID=UPI00036821E0|nr:hypothetical protein [Methylobacterium sp. WSM2598]
MDQSLASAAAAPSTDASSSAAFSPDATKPSLRKGLLLTSTGVLIGCTGYYYSYVHHSVIGTLVGVLGLALCVLGTAKSEGPVHH